MSFAAGARLGPYEIQSALGSGGMGEVYRARDPRLGRDVAIKVLPEHRANDPEALAALEREARAVAALSHPNIVAIHDCGTDQGVFFAVTELLKGETLRSRLARGALSWRQALEIAVGIAEGLSAAHAKGIVHRDLKPENIFLTADGLVKILDFGLARWKPAALASDLSLAETAPGTVMGTVGYMSPEQVRGAAAESTSDIFALGCVLYEMLVGKRAFERGTAVETLAAILNADVPELTQFDRKLPLDLEPIVARCLEKEPARRFQSARDLAFALRSVLTGSGVSRPTGRRAEAKGRPRSLAVLPLANAGTDASMDYLSDGITESVINSLSQLPRLRVMARSTVFRYKGRKVDPLKVGRDLNVEAVLTGRVLLRGETLSIGLELVDVANGWQLWGAQYTRTLEDIFQVQEEISHEISNKLKLRLSGDERKRLAKRHTENVEAYQAYLKGRYCWNKRTEEEFKKSIDFFQQAIEADPVYALAYAGLADSYALLGIAEYGGLPPREAMPRAKAAAARALELDDRLAEARTSLAHVKAFYDWDWTGAEQEFKTALRVNPNYAFAHHWYALFLAAMERPEEAIAAEKRAQELEPLSPIINKNVGTIYYYAARYDEAIDHYVKAVNLDRDFARTRYFLGMAYQATSRFDEAIAELERAISLSGGSSVMLATLGSTYGLAGRREDATRVLAKLRERSTRQYVPSFSMAMIHAGLGQADQTFEALEKAYEERSSWLVSLKVEPIFRPLRTDPRFNYLLRRVGLLAP